MLLYLYYEADKLDLYDLLQGAPALMPTRYYSRFDLMSSAGS